MKEIKTSSSSSFETPPEAALRMTNIHGTGQDDFITADEIEITPSLCRRCGFCVRQMNCFRYAAPNWRSGGGIELDRALFEELVRIHGAVVIRERVAHIARFCKSQCITPAIRIREADDAR